MSDKPRMILIRDAKQIAAIMFAGKYREHLPFWTRDGEALWTVKPATTNNPGKL